MCLMSEYIFQVDNKPVEWSTPAGQQLKQSLILSNEAKKFAIAREIIHVLQYQPEIKAFINLSE